MLRLVSDNTHWEASFDRSILLIAAPGDELPILHWIERVRPLVLLLTDGTDPTSNFDVASTTAVLKRSHARIGPIFARYSGVQFQESFSLEYLDRFAAIAEEIAEIILRESATSIVGYPTHRNDPAGSIARCLIDAAMETVFDVNPLIRNYCISDPIQNTSTLPSRIQISLNDCATDRKKKKLDAIPENERICLERLQNSLYQEAFQIATPWEVLWESQGTTKTNHLRIWNELDNPPEPDNSYWQNSFLPFARKLLKLTRKQKLRAA